MRTTKSISNLAYHRPEVFAERVRELRASGVIGPCLWIAHKGEGGDKDHIHVLLLGGVKTYNTDGLSSLFGFDVFPDGSKGSMTPLWKTTKEASDWVLYGIHDPRYLVHKGETKEHSYSFDDIKCCEEDEDLLRTLVIDAKAFLENLGDKVILRVKKCFWAGMSLGEVLTSGLVPIGCVGNVVKVWDALEASRTYSPDNPKA